MTVSKRKEKLYLAIINEQSRILTLSQ